MIGSSTLMLARGLTVSGHLTIKSSICRGSDIENTQYGGTVNFQKANNLFGFLRFSVGVVDAATQDGNSGLGLVANLSMTRKFGRWETAADVNYSQNTETLLCHRNNQQLQLWRRRSGARSIRPHTGVRVSGNRAAD